MAITMNPDTHTERNYSIVARAAENFKIVTGSWSCPSTYATGGITANLATLGFTTVFFANFVSSDCKTQYDYTNDTVLLYYPLMGSTTATWKEIPADSEQTACSGYFVAMGWGAR